MRIRIQAVVVLIAWLLSTGAQWDVAQFVAWGRMISTYSQEMAFGDAVQETFTGKLCPLCKAVQKGKQEQEDKGGSTAPGKVKPWDLCAPAVGTQVAAPRLVVIRRGLPELPSSGEGRRTPPVPPPRVA